MYTIALRFSEKFAPEEGTIIAHESLIKTNGFVWYGKMGSAMANEKINIVLNQPNPRILLIHSGTMKRYWAYISDITKEKPAYSQFPNYYHSIADNFHTWFKVYRFEKADKDIMSKCRVVSSGQVLTLASKHSMSPYFFIETDIV